MPEIQKPSTLNIIWADAGDKIKPDDGKIQTGWLVEIPTRQNENWIQNRQDQFIAHVNQHGIATWDDKTEYLKDFSLSMGSDGAIYRCKTTNIGQDPVTTSGYWAQTIIDGDSELAIRKFIGYSFYSSDFTAQVNTRVYATATLTMTLPEGSVAGDIITVNKSPLITVKIIATGNMIVTSLGSSVDVDFDLNDEINLVSNGINWEV